MVDNRDSEALVDFEVEVDDDLYEALKKRAALEGITVDELASKAVKWYINNKLMEKDKQ